MAKYREIVPHILNGLSVAVITKLVGCSARDVTAARALIAEYGITRDNVDLQPDSVFDSWKPDHRRDRSAGFDQPDFAAVVAAFRKLPHHTLGVAWENYLNAPGSAAGLRKYSYSTFCARFTEFAGKSGAAAVMIHTPGQVMHVDWVGDPVYVTDQVTAAKTKVSLFCAVMPYSQCTHVSAWLDQKQASWQGAHAAALEYFGRAPKIVIPDNATTATVRGKKDDLSRTVNVRYEKLCRHYGLAVFPTDAYSPKHKAAVERAMGTVESYIIARLEQQVFYHLEDLREELFDLVEKVNKQLKTPTGETRWDLFCEDEVPVMNPLPTTPFSEVVYQTRKVGRNICVQVDQHFYSVPFTYIGEEVTVKVTASEITIIHDDTVIAKHPHF